MATDPRMSLKFFACAMALGLNVLADLAEDATLTDDERRRVRLVQSNVTHTWQSVYVLADELAPERKESSR
jgi:fructoselysine-6-P-deglycase FrlB-like protein